MGTLVRAHDERLGRDVAIKRVKNVHGLTAAIFLARFEAEARALAALSHPGVVAVYDSGVDGDEPFLVMELLAGPSLKDDLVDARGAQAGRPRSRPSASSSPAPSRPPTPAASSTATSSPPTSCAPPTAPGS
jgi:serine/threonine protein kinase